MRYILFIMVFLAGFMLGASVEMQSRRGEEKSRRKIVYDSTEMVRDIRRQIFNECSDNFRSNSSRTIFFIKKNRWDSVLYFHGMAHAYYEMEHKYYP